MSPLERRSLFDGLLDEIEARFRGLDPFDLAACLHLVHGVFDAETHSDATTAQMVAAAELGTQVAASMSVGPPSPVQDPMVAVRDVHDALRAAVWASIPEEFGLSTPLEDLRSRLVTQARLIRNVARDDQELAALQRVLDDDGARPHLAAATGIDGESVVSLLRAIGVWVSTALDKLDGDLAGAGIGSEVAFSDRSLAESTGVDLAACRAFLTMLATEVGDTPRPTVADNEWVPQRRPLVKRGANYLCSSPPNLLRAVRPALERAVKRQPARWERYQRARARVTEAETMRLLVEFFRPDVALQNLRFEGRAGDGEIDGLLVVDSAVILVEVKAGSLRAADNRMDSGRFRQAVSEFVVAPAKQLSRARAAVLAEQPLRDGRGRGVELPVAHVQRCYTMAVTLEDLSFAAPVLWTVQDAGLLSRRAALPWLVSLSQVDSICDVLEWPVQLLDYLDEHERLMRKRIVRAADELDVLMAYLNGDVDLHALDDPSVEQILLPSGTDQLARWVMYRQGIRATPTPRPQQAMAMAVKAKARSRLRHLDTERPSNWLAESRDVLREAVAASPARWIESGRLF